MKDVVGWPEAAVAIVFIVTVAYVALKIKGLV
jgi:hypothetical protein